MQKREEIEKKLRSSLAAVKKNFAVKSLGIFGSYVRNEQTNLSDVDILVEFEKTPGLFKFLELEEYLTSITGVKVDLVMKTSLKPFLGKVILNEVVYL
ncbi:nucleotidyltransferase family protein [Candidatus Micrarchaeota archaeon]|nr:nucleotidyltransferase family protein [Candidatus Micrarchaeota archaeon]